MTMALEDLRVLDCTQVLAGPFCCMLLADLGADVVKVEPPEVGDQTRGWAPFLNGESGPFMAVNRNKRGITLNIKDARGQAAFRRLAEQSDVLVENYRPGVLARHGLDYASLQAVNPRLIYCTISGFGVTGPYADRGGFDLIAQGMSGLMSITGHPGRPPVKVGVPLADLAAGMFALYGVLGAVIARQKTGQGQFIDTSLIEAPIAWSVWEATSYFATGEVPGPLGSGHRLSAPYQALQTKDGYINVGAANQRLWERLCAILDRPRLVSDPRFADNSARHANLAELVPLLEEVTRQGTTREWWEKFEAVGLPSGPIYTYDQVFADPQVQARQMVQQIHHPVAGDVRVLGNPVKMSATPPRLRLPAPTLGQHTEEVLSELGLSAAEIAACRADRVI